MGDLLHRLNRVGPKRFDHEGVATIKIREQDFHNPIGAVTLALPPNRDRTLEGRGAADERGCRPCMETVFIRQGKLLGNSSNLRLRTRENRHGLESRVRCGGLLIKKFATRLQEKSQFGRQNGVQ